MNPQLSEPLSLSSCGEMDQGGERFRMNGAAIRHGDRLTGAMEMGTLGENESRISVLGRKNGNKAGRRREDKAGSVQRRQNFLDSRNQEEIAATCKIIGERGFPRRKESLGVLARLTMIEKKKGSSE